MANSRFPAVSLLVCFCAALPAGAYVTPRKPPDPRIETISPNPPLALTEAAIPASQLEAQPSWRGFLGESGGSWMVRLDRRTGLPSLVWGSGIPWIPGRGNSLPRSMLPADVDLRGWLSSTALDFVATHPALMGADPAALVLNPNRSLSVEDGTVWQVEFGYAPGGTKVVGAYVFFRMEHGNLVQFGTRNILRDPGVSPVPTLTAAQARAVGEARLGAEDEELEVLDPGSLYYLPQAEGARLVYRLVWQSRFRRRGELPDWTALVDAHSGDLIAFYDAGLYACDPALLARGKVDGGVHPVTVLDPEEVRAFPFVTVNTPTGTVITGFNGIYPYDGGRVTTTLSGRYGNIDCQGCSNPPQPFVEDSITGDLHLGFGGVNEVGNGTSTPADRTAFYHVARARSLGARWIPDLPYFTSNIRIHTQYLDPLTCNARYTGDLQFFRPDPSCLNPGENPGVIQHEWGHGLHVNGLDYDNSLTPAPGFDGSYSEGVGDHVDWITDHDPRIGPGFYTDGRPVRRVDDEATNLRTLSNNPNCPQLTPIEGGGYDGYEVHCGGLIWSQADWHLKDLLVAKYGDAAGWTMIERLFFSAVPLTETHVPNQPHSAYDSYALLLDDDGNLANGVPDAQELNDAYNHHELASTPNYDVSGTDLCDPGPTAPALDLLPVLDPATNSYQVQVRWTPVAGASFYDLLRSADGPDKAFQPVALNLPQSQDLFVDTEVNNKLTYEYRLQVVDPNACFSRNDDTATAVVDLTELGIDSVTVADDSGNGVLVPGEGGDLVISLADIGAAAASGVSADLMALTPGVMVVQGTSVYPDIPGGGAAVPSGVPFHIAVDPNFDLCGATLQFRLAMESDQGCWDASFSIVVGGARTRLGIASVSLSDFAVGNASGSLDPGETADLTVTLQNEGPGDSPATTATIIPLDPALAVQANPVSYGDVAGGASSPGTPYQIQLDPSFACGDTVSFQVLIQSDAGCWTDVATLPAGTFEVLRKDDMEDDSGWSVGDPSDTATTGIWERAAPEATIYQPGSDHTPGAGTHAWVTGAAAGNRVGDNDVDGGCTTLTSPVWDLTGSTGTRLSYWRWYVNETVLDDPFEVEISNNGGLDWAGLETVPGTDTPWKQAVFDLDARLGSPGRVRLRFRACDQGGGSLTEALIDDLELGRWVCDAPEPRSELVVDSWSAADGRPGPGNSDGILDPGELVEVRLDLRNVRNADARNVTATVSAPPWLGTFVAPVATAPDVAPGQVQPTDAPHVLFRIADTFDGCYGSIPLDVTLDYSDDGGPRVSRTSLDLVVGAIGPEETRFYDDFDGPDDRGWTHAQVATQDDWERGPPQGKNEDPAAAYSGTDVWGNDLGDGTNGRYAANVDNYLQSPSFDLRGFGRTQIRFERWLAVEEGIYDQALILVNGNVVWRNPNNGDLVDTEWTQQQLDVSAFADNQSAVTVRFELITDGGKQLGGWNLDDFQVLSSPFQCGRFCDGPPPSTGASLRVRRTKEDRVLLDWSGYAGAASMEVYDSDTASDLPPSGTKPPTTAVTGVIDDVGPAGAPPGLEYFRILAVNGCGEHE